jgi:hypothetical protein
MESRTRIIKMMKSKLTLHPNLQDRLSSVSGCVPSWSNNLRNSWHPGIRSSRSVSSAAITSSSTWRELLGPRLLSFRGFLVKWALYRRSHRTFVRPATQTLTISTSRPIMRSDEKCPNTQTAILLYCVELEPCSIPCPLKASNMPTNAPSIGIDRCTPGQPRGGGLPLGLLHQIAQRKRHRRAKTTICLVPRPVEELCSRKHRS